MEFLNYFTEHEVYRPRKAKGNWLNEAPSYVLDCFNVEASGNKPYYVFLGVPFVFENAGVTFVSYINASSSSKARDDVWRIMRGDLVAQFRMTNRKKRIRWVDLPESVKGLVVECCMDEN